MKNIVTLLLVLILVSCSSQSKRQIDYGSNPDAGNYIDVNGIKVYYEIYGEGEPLLLLHGNAGSIETFFSQIPELSKHFKVVAVDSRAQGRTSDSDQEISYALMASDMSELIDQLNLEKVNIVGFSDGGNIGLELAYSFPEKVLKVITFGANYTHETSLADIKDVTMDPNDQLIVRTSLGRKKFSSAAERLSPDLERLPIIKEKLQVLMDKYPNFTLDQLKTIDVPFMIVAGDHDLINIDQTISLFKSLPKTNLFIVPGATHLSLMEHPELINKEIIRFLKSPYRDIDGFYFLK